MAKLSDVLPFPSGGNSSTKGKKNDSAKPAKAVDMEKNPTIAVEHAKESAKQPVRKRQRLRNHCARFWLCYTIGSIILLAITLPITFLKIIPAVVQRIIDNIDLPVMDARIAAESPTELALSFTTVFAIPGGFSVQMDPYGLSLYNAFTPGFYPYSYIELPESALHLKGATRISINTTAPVLNATEASKWTYITVNDATTTFSLRGATVLHLGALKMPVNIDKSVTVPALNKLKGFGLDSFQLILPAESDGTNMVGNMTLPNVSAMDINLGNISFNGSVSNIVIANLTVSDALLLRGNNTIPFRGQLYLDTITSNIGSILGNSSSLSGGNLNMIIEDGQSVVNGQHIKFIETVLAETPLVASVPLTQLLQSALGSILAPAIRSLPGEAMNASVDRMLKDEENSMTIASGQAESEPSGSNAAPSPRLYAEDLRTLDVLKAARLYQALQRKKKV